MKTRIAMLVLLFASASAWADGPEYAYDIPDQNGQPRQMTPDDWTRNADGRAEDPDNPMSTTARAFRNGWIQRGDYDAKQMQPQQPPPLPPVARDYTQPLPRMQQQPQYDPNQVQEVYTDQPDYPPPQYAQQDPYYQEPPHLVRSPAPVYYGRPPAQYVQQYEQPWYGPTPIVIQPAMRGYPGQFYPRGYGPRYDPPNYAYRQAPRYYSYR
jgi:hypothetical protein